MSAWVFRAFGGVSALGLLAALSGCEAQVPTTDAGSNAIDAVAESDTSARSDLGVTTDAGGLADAGPDADSSASEIRQDARDVGTSPSDAGSPLDVVRACFVRAPTACPDPPPRYADVAPIITAHCIPCHNGVPNGPWSLIGYEHVADWQGTIRDELIQCTMPPPDAGTRLTDEERMTILVWLRCGLPR